MPRIHNAAHASVSLSVTASYLDQIRFHWLPTKHILCQVAFGAQSTTFWALHICTIKTLLITVLNNGTLGWDNEVETMYRYVCYHDSMAVFSLRHHRLRHRLNSTLTATFRGQSYEFNCDTSFAVSHRDNSLRRVLFVGGGADCRGLFLKITGLQQHMPYESVALGRVLDCSLVPGDSEYHTPQYQDKIKALGNDIRNKCMDARRRYIEALANFVPTGEPSRAELNRVLAQPVHFYFFLVGLWIFFTRTSKRLNGPSEEIEAMVKEAFELIPNVSYGVSPFAILLLGSEATTEERRRAILDLSDRIRGELGTSLLTDTDVPGCQVLRSCHMLKTLWKHDDLHDNSEGYLDYATKMQSVMTAEPIPAFV